MKAYVVIGLDLESDDPGINRVWGPWRQYEEASDYADYIVEHNPGTQRGKEIQVSAIENVHDPRMP
jgi:hypothetical protein